MLYIVDDTADYRFLVQQVFKLFLPTYSLRSFADGIELIEYVEQQIGALVDKPTGAIYYQESSALPGLIVLDIDMPKLSGFQTLKRLKQHPHWQSVPVVMMSNRLERGYREAAHELGAVAYLSKPMNIFEMRDVMEKLCQEWLDV